MIPAHAGPTARTIASGVLVAVAVATSMLSLTSIILPGGWTRAGLVGIVLVSATTVTTRVVLERRARAQGRRAREQGSAWPSLLGCVVAGWFVLARFGGPTADPTFFVTPEHVSRVVARLGEAGEIARSEVSPVTGSVPIGLLAVGGTLLVLLLADALAGALRRPAAVGLPLLALWAPPLVLTGRVPWGVFVVTVTALLLLLTLDGPLAARTRRQERSPAPVRRAERSRAVATTAAAAVLAVVAGLVGSASAALPGGPAGWYRAFTTTGDTIRLAEDLDILRSLTDRSSSVVLTYDTGAETDVGPLRSYTATAFDGRRWQRGEERAGRDFGAGDVLWPDDPPAGQVAVRTVTVDVGELRDDKLPLTVDPREVDARDAGADWGYDATRDEVVGGLTGAGDSYTLTVHERELSPARLREAPEADIDPVYTQVPDTAHAGDVAQTAGDVVGDADTAYDQAVALQRWLRDPSRFTYSTTIPRGGTGDPVWDFLQNRTGYCIQFATTMVVMARSLGIPARIAVGYLPGDRTGDTTWQITGQDSHAWPEIYFPGTGWVRFEPTPAQQTGSAPTYTVPRVQGQPAPVPSAADLGDRRPTSDSTSGDDTSPTASTAAVSTPIVDTGLPAWVWITAGSLIVVLAGGLVLLLARRRRAGQELDPELAWQQVLAALAAEGVRLPPATTLRRAPEAIASAVSSRAGRDLAPEVVDDLTTLAGAAESSRYAREPQTPDQDELERLTGAVTAGLGDTLGSR
ncbi:MULTISPECIES: transglutaminase family protein [unclassified Isoptericola]|uniref:transglutaminase family protein n=1 Tax=Isoptericola sp. NPDC057191 TaxID=3346041 RepID=UPI003627CC63